jgi:hypothetical protein
MAPGTIGGHWQKKYITTKSKRTFGSKSKKGRENKVNILKNLFDFFDFAVINQPKNPLRGGGKQRCMVVLIRYCSRGLIPF